MMRILRLGADPLQHSRRLATKVQPFFARPLDVS
jgi:hypothetical protein